MKTSENQLNNAKRYRQRNKTKISEQSKLAYRNDLKLYTYHMMKRAERRAKKYNLPFDITIKDIFIPEVCPVFGCSFSVSSGSGPGDFSPSIDKIIPEKGYVKGNIRIICAKANRIKSDASIDEVRKVLNYMLS
jgi:hypothetical protein